MLPMLQFAYWRLGVLRDASVYTSMTGWDSYYIGIGGEIGGDSANELTNGVLLTGSGPWGGTHRGPGQRDPPALPRW